MQLQQLTSHLDDYLDINSIEDVFYNGLQVEGSTEIIKIGLAVDAGLATFNKAIEQDINFLIVHHGIFSSVHNPSLTSWMKRRVALLLEHNISLYCAHLPLDRHPEVGNNVVLLNLLNTEHLEPLSPVANQNIGWLGQYSQPVPLDELVQQVKQVVGLQFTTIKANEKPIQRIAALSGGGSYRGFYEALSSKADLYLTGDTAELYQTARDADINVIFAGHYNTELVGIKALADQLSSSLDLPIEVIDIPTNL